MSKKTILLDSGILKLRRRLMEAGDDNGIRLELARAYNIRAMFTDALEQSRRILDRGTDQSGEAWFHAIRATFFLDEKMIPELLEEFLARTEGMEDEPWHARNLALLHFYAGEEEEARRTLEALLEREPGDSRAWETLGNIHYNQDEIKAAIECIETSVKQNPSDVTAYHLLGTCHYKNQDASKSLFYYQKAVQLEEKFARGWISLGEFFLLDEESYSKAMQCFSTATAINPLNWDSYFFLIDHYIGARKYELAMAECHRILELEPVDSIRAEAHNYIGYIHFKLGMYDDAERGYRRALELDPQFSSPHQNLGLLYLSRKERDRARIHFKRAIRLDPTSSWSHTKLGYIYLDERVIERAEEHFRAAMDNDAEDFWALLGMAEVSRLRRQYKDQLAWCRKAVKLQPDHTNVWNHLGIANECNRRYDEAEEAYQKAMELDPFNRWAANNLGYLYEKLMKKEKEADYREKAIQIWKKRLQICSKTGTSVQGATRHLIKLGIPKKQVETWLLAE